MWFGDLYDLESRKSHAFAQCSRHAYRCALEIVYYAVKHPQTKYLSNGASWNYSSRAALVYGVDRKSPRTLEYDLVGRNLVNDTYAKGLQADLYVQMNHHTR